MPAYLIVQGEVHDPAGYAEYKRRAAPLVAEYGGRYLARGGDSARLEGEWLPRFVLVEFPSYDVALRFYHSPEYQECAAIRQRCSTSALAILDAP